MREPQGPWFAPGSADPGQTHGSSSTAPQGGGIRAGGRQKPAAFGRALTPSGAQQTAANGTESRHKTPNAGGWCSALPARARAGGAPRQPLGLGCLSGAADWTGTDGDRGRV